MFLLFSRRNCFSSEPFHMSVLVAEWVARWTSNPEFPGSSPGEGNWFEFVRTFCRCRYEIIMYLFHNMFLKFLSLGLFYLRRPLHVAPGSVMDSALNS